MQLTIQRSQEDKKGMLGGHKGVAFTLSTRISFTEEERQLLEHYKMWGYTVLHRGELPLTLGHLAQGDTQSISNGEILLDNEEAIKEALDPIPSLLAVLRSFGGEETIQYPRTDG